MTPRTAVYARVSTARQEQEQTVASQIDALDRAASAMGITIAPERRFVDEGFSGSRLDRPGLDALRDAAADGLLDRVLVYCPDRLARNYVHQHVLIEELNRRGVEVHFVERPIGERAEDRLLVQMQGVIAEYERAKIIERTRRGKVHKLRSGQMIPYSNQAPYGYAVTYVAERRDRVVVVDAVEADTLRAMFRWVLDEGLSARGVAKRLNTQGVRPRRARAWTQSTVYAILTNPAYTGLAPYSRRECVEPKRPKKPGAYRRNAKSSPRPRPEAQWLRVPIPALVDETVMREVRGRLKKNKLTAMRNTQYEYLLRTLVVCGECGWRMECSHQIRCGSPYEYFYYSCRHADLLEGGPDRRCTAKRVRQDELDAVVWDAITTWIQSPQMLMQEVQAWRSSRAGAEQVTRDRVRLETAERRLGEQVARLIDAYQRGALSVDELRARRERLEASRDAARARIEEIAGEEMDGARLERVGDDIEIFAATLRAGLDKLDFQGRQRLVRLLVERVVLTGEHVAIEHAIPLSGRFCGFASTGSTCCNARSARGP